MEPQIVHRNAQPVLCIRKESNPKDLYPTVDALTELLMEYCTQRHITPVGGIYTAYLGFENGSFLLEVGLPTDKSYPGEEDILSAELTAGTYVQVLYQGPYQKMRPFYAQLEEWLHNAGYKSGPVNYERYLNSSKDVPVSELLTEVSIPLMPV